MNHPSSLNQQGASPSHLNHSSVHDTLRWGDYQTLLGLETLQGGEASNVVTKQLIAAHWRWPLTWTLWVVFQPDFDPTETATFTASLQVSLGVGQAVGIAFPLNYAIAPTGGVYIPVTDQRFMPAQDLQIAVKVTGKAALTNATGKDNLGVGLFVAPQTEPHAMTEILDRMNHEEQERVRWMREGFHDTPLGYGR